MPEPKPLQQRFRGVLEGVAPIPGWEAPKGMMGGLKRDRALQTFATSLPPIEAWAAAMFGALTPEELAGASVRVVELVVVDYKVIRPPAPDAKGAA
jgi:hypothetical protein